MDRATWMYKLPRVAHEYVSGVNEFISCAVENLKKKGTEHGNEEMITCPCRDCSNLKKYPNVETVREHLFRRGFMKDYTKWIWHGEGIQSRKTETISRNNENYGDDMEDTNKEDDVENDRVHEMIEDVEDLLMHQPEVLEHLVDDSKKPLYPGCSDQFTRLSTTLKLCKLKVKNGWSDKSFTEMLKLLADILPLKNELPTSTYEAKKILCPMGMNVKKIHACPNHCVLFRNEHEHLHACPKCGASRFKREGSNSCTNDKKRPPVKVLRYLPIVERFKRLFANVNDAKLLRWHVEGRKSDGMLRHPADSPQWRTIDGKFPEFGGELRNLRLGLSADGMNPYRTLSSQHSTWPVVLTIYNLPPWLCMKRKYIMLALLIPGPKEAGNDIDVYLQPLIEDLMLLWDQGVEIYDAYSRTNFILHAMVFCTISDFPGYGNLSGYSVKGANACPICEDATIDIRLHNCKKNVYMGHRTFLPLNHPYRKNKKSFDGTIETRVARLPLTGKEVFQRVKDIDVVLGKLYKRPTVSSVWKKRSIFWDLPYWEHLQVRHCLDFMHIEKNVCESIIGTLLNIPGKTKDGMKARLDLQEMGIRAELAPQQSGKRTYLPPACFTLSRKEKISLCECLSTVKVPSGYSSNPKNFVSMKDLKLIGLKSHDCHVLMQHLLPVAIRGILPKDVRLAITKLCFFFNAICSKVIDPMTLDKLQADIIVTLCEFEMYFFHSFFDIMVHLVVHLVREVKICGPLYLHQMYPFERFLCILKAYVRNRRLPEASIVEGYTIEETIEFCTDYLASTDRVGIPISRHEGRLQGQGTLGHKMISPSAEMLDRAHLFVLQHMTDVHSYLQEHLFDIQKNHPSKSGKWVTNEHNRSFVKWFRDRVMLQYSSSHSSVSNTVKWLAYGPDMPVRSYQAYDVNGYTFYTQCQDQKSTVQNSGVCVEASSTEFDRGNSMTSRDIKKSYYGVIEEIWELDYRDFKVALFKCKWFDIKRGVRVDDSGFTLVDFVRFGHEDDPFIFATQVNQVFYIRDPADPKWSIVLQSKRCIVGIDNVEDEEEYNQFDDNPPFSIGIQTTTLREDNVDINYARNDHDEGRPERAQESVNLPHLAVLTTRVTYIQNCRRELVLAWVIAMNDDDATSGSRSVSNKKRGPTICKKLKKRIENQKLECTINFDEYGQPCGDMLKDFTIYLGSVVRFQVDINLESWDAVNQGLKDVIWDDIKSHWKLDDSRKKIVLEKAAKHWRDFKGKLTKNFLRAGKDPCEVYHFISREQWETYKKRRESEEFKAISEKAKQSQKHNEHVHFLGSSGYRAKRTKWCVEDPIANLENLESLDSSILSSDRSSRSYDWVRARTKKKEDGSYYIPNSQTKEVFDKMGELQKQVSDGSWTPQGHDDILSRALGRKEHGGRVRGVGGGAKIKDVFGSGKSKQSGVISMDELATITQEITKKVQRECDEKMEMMNTKLHGIFQYLKQMGLSLPENNFMDDIENPSPGIVRSSCQSVGGEDHISELMTPTLCRLCVLDKVKGRVVVARGTVFPSNNERGNMIHNNPVAPQNIRVSVDDVVPEYQLTPLPVPCSEHETIGNAEGSFVQWPKELVNLGQDPVSLEKKKGLEKSPKNVVRRLESKGSTTPVKKGSGDENSTQNCRSLRYLLEQSGSKGATFTFQDGGIPIYVTYEDVDQFLKKCWLNIPILEIFSKYTAKLCKELNDDTYAFMSPSRLVINHKRDYKRIDEVIQYMTEFLVANKDKRFIFAPYIQDDHWMLLMFSLEESVIYVFDSLRRERDIRLTTPARTAFKLYVPQGGRKNNRKEFLWYHTDVKCPQQLGGTECGFFIMRYMYEIITLSQKNPNTNWKEGLGSRRYTKKEINEVRELWAEFFTVECL